jgi:hypothetical protein
MEDFAIRIELNGTPSSAIYDQLHDAMKKNNITRTITGESGVEYTLPHATYCCTGDLSAAQVRDIILPVVKGIWIDCELIVFRFDQAAWTLRPSRPGSNI